MDPAANPFAVMSLIVAPAILTNACSVLVMSTSNRLARAVDRARELSKQLEATERPGSEETARRLRELLAAETRALLLVRALRSLYTGLGGFAAAALISLLGAVMFPMGARSVVLALEIAAVIAGLAAVLFLVHASVLLVRDTRIAVQVIQDRADRVRTRLEGRASSDDSTLRASESRLL